MRAAPAPCGRGGATGARRVKARVRHARVRAWQARSGRHSLPAGPARTYRLPNRLHLVLFDAFSCQVCLVVHLHGSNECAQGRGQRWAAGAAPNPPLRPGRQALLPTCPASSTNAADGRHRLPRRAQDARHCARCSRGPGRPCAPPRQHVTSGAACNGNVQVLRPCPSRPRPSAQAALQPPGCPGVRLQTTPGWAAASRPQAAVHSACQRGADK